MSAIATTYFWAGVAAGFAAGSLITLALSLYFWYQETKHADSDPRR